jgi:hypothetical protein
MTPVRSESPKGDRVAKSKKKKDKKKDRKSASGGTTASRLKVLAENPLVADVVAAALVATASALKDSKRARALASEAGDELAKLSKAGAKSGEALWEMALQVGRRSLEALVAGEEPRKSAQPKATPKAGSKPKSRSKPKLKSAGKKKTAAAARR